MKYKEKNIIIFLALLIGIISYFGFLKGFYSIDTERILSQGYYNYAINDAYIKDGRTFSALIFGIIGKVMPYANIKIEYIINIILAIFILSLATLELYKIINNYIKRTDLKNKVISFLLSSTYIFSCMQIDSMQFIDSFIICTSVLLFIISLKQTIILKNNKKGFIIALISIFCYQGSIPMYIATAFLFTLLESKKFDSKFLKTISICAINIVIVSIINLLFVNIVPHVMNLTLTNRIENVNYIEEFIQNINKYFDVICGKDGYFPEYLMLIISTIIITISIFNKNKRIAINELCIFLIYTASGLVMISLSVMERTLLPLGEIISAMLIYGWCNFNETYKISYKILEILIFVFFSFNLINNIYLTKQFMEAQKIDKIFAEEVENELENLNFDKTQNLKISKYYTGSGKRLKDKKYSPVIFLNSIYLTNTYTEYMLEFYMNNSVKIEQLPIDKQIIEENFKIPSDQEIQMKMINDILYIVVDL